MNDDQPPPIVEFVGLPAVGKTYLASETKDRVQALLGPDTRVTTSTEKRAGRSIIVVGFLVVGFLVRRPITATRWLIWLIRTRQSNRRIVLRYWLYQLYICAEQRRVRAAGELHLADQGFLQHAWRVHLTARSTSVDSLRQFFHRNMSDLPDVVIFVEVDHRTRMERGVERGTPVKEEFFDPEHPEIQRDIRTYRDIITVVHSLSNKDASGLTTTRIENTESAFAENVEHLADELADTMG